MSDSHVALPATPRTDEIAAKLEREGLQYSFRMALLSFAYPTKNGSDSGFSDRGTK